MRSDKSWNKLSKQTYEEIRKVLSTSKNEYLSEIIRGNHAEGNVWDVLNELFQIHNIFKQPVFNKNTTVKEFSKFLFSVGHEKMWKEDIEIDHLLFFLLCSIELNKKNFAYCDIAILYHKIKYNKEAEIFARKGLKFINENNSPDEEFNKTWNEILNGVIRGRVDNKYIQWK